MQKLVEHVRSACSRSASISREPGNALTRFFFLSQMDVSRQRPDASRPFDALIPYEAVQDACLHRELLKAGIAVDEADRICQDLSKAASDAVEVDTPATTDT